MSAVCERKRERRIFAALFQSATRSSRYQACTKHRHENSTSRHRSLPSQAYAAQARQPCKEICRSCAHVMVSCTVRVWDALPEMLMSDSKVWSKKKRKMP